MTKNRAHKRAARAIAAVQNIRYPEAVALADDKVEHSAPARPQELDMDDLQLARLAAELNSTDLVFAPGVIGSRSTGTEKLYRLIRDANGTGEATTDQEPDPMTSSTDEPDTTALQLFTGRPGTGRTARGWSQIEAADAALNTLGIPQAAQEFATFPDGLFLITGATGSGKTMTGAALLRRAHYEKGHMAAAVMLDCEMSPLLDSGVALYPAEHQADTAPALRQAVADGAKIIFVDGLPGDPESTEAVLDTALGGALVIATMHSKASDAAQRLLDAFPDSGSKKIRAKVQLALRGVIGQALVRGESGTGRVLAGEVWAEGTDGELAPVLTFQDSLHSLVDEGTVLQVEADRVTARGW